MEITAFALDATAQQRLGVDDIAFVLQQNRLRWYGHVLRKEDDDSVKKCMEYEVEGPRPRGRPKRTWREVVREDCQARKMNKVQGWVFAMAKTIFAGTVEKTGKNCGKN